MENWLGQSPIFPTTGGCCSQARDGEGGPYRPAARLGSRGQSSRSSVADAKASARRGGGLASSSGRGWLGRGAVRRIGR
jgi:hypothetical protein